MTDAHTNHAPALMPGVDAARLPGLDAVRALAIAAVLAYHLNVPGLFNAGFLGVDVFFGLSGFLITSLMLREFSRHGQIDIGRYFWRRFVRLMPAVAVLLLVTLVLTPQLLPTAQRRLQADLPWAGVYLANWWQICSAQSYFENFGHPPLLRHLWSLGVEMQYYLVWPWLLLGLLRLAGVRGALLASALLALASSGWMATLFGQYPDNPSRAYLGADSHSMGLFLGSALACLWSPLHPAALLRQPLAWGVRLSLGGAALVALLALMWFSNEAQPLLYQGGFLATAVASAALVASGADLWPKPHTARLWRLATAGVQWLGTRSYSIYLWHWPLFIYLKGNSTPRLWVLVQCLILTAIVAEISYRWVEGALAFTTQQWPAFRQRGAGYLALGLLLLGGVAVVKFTPCQSPVSPAAPPPATAPTAPLASPPGGSASAPDPRAIVVAVPSMATHSDTLAIGDSVMLGARQRMLRTLPAFTVDAEVGRQPRQSVTLVERYLANNPGIARAVIHIGTNGYILKSDLRRLLTALGGAQQVVLVNTYADRRWSEANNRLIAQIAPEFRNVRVMDWHQTASGNRHYFVQDGIHLSSDGITAFVQGIAGSLGVALVDVGPGAPRAPRRPASALKPASSAHDALAGVSAPMPASADAAPHTGQEAHPPDNHPPPPEPEPAMPNDSAVLKSETQLKGTP